ncbi:hypothetical protein [Jannaschia aquimarina]|uniref:Uncharacterized protein n=1 Tax=Jannaschia aquimarina TaxID=935700 RepID=A0A0D1DAY0_9RHOB|nr:hypothetical protein [Jannaschia aquimarina]KIT17098.1 hypothetical protein jaqu_11400 [Jannaschia aquimarina]SNS46760.1 hypothetical protein SAMN05421775_10161 [Jannaschia aquimarina]
MIRPELQALFWRWREVIGGAGLVVLGLALWVGSAGLPALFGLAALAVGVVLLIPGLRRARFRGTADGPGVVDVTEGHISYFGPTNGGAVALDLLEEVSFDGAARAWRLEDSRGEVLVIPEGASGSEALLEALAPLPGFDAGHMVRAVRERAPTSRVVWTRRARPALT